VNCRITIDARHLHSGISRHVVSMVRRLVDQDLPGDLLLVTRKQFLESHLMDIGSLETRVIEAPLHSLRAQVLLPFLAADCDLLHATHYAAPLFHPRRMLVSIYDLVPLSPSFLPNRAAWLYSQMMHRAVAKRATHITTLSDYSKGQIVEMLHVPASRVTTIYCGVSPAFLPQDREVSLREVARHLGVQGPYLLYVGNLKPHKNVAQLIRAFALLRERRFWPDQLLLIGEDAKWKPRLEELCVELGVRDRVIFASHISDEWLAHAYGAAEVSVQPSFLEGFGLPVVEAMACGCPVVCADAASLPEVAGDAAEFFDPHQVESLVEAVEKVAGSSELRGDLVRKGFQRAKRFTWSECARQHSELYRKLLHN
jgi:glycosyltransferase involved in cell wall biosynthesis